MRRQLNRQLTWLIALVLRRELHALAAHRAAAAENVRGATLTFETATAGTTTVRVVVAAAFPLQYAVCR